MPEESITTATLAAMVGADENTVLRWLQEGLLRQSMLDSNGQHIFCEPDIERARVLARAESSGLMSSGEQTGPAGASIARLRNLDWDFTAARTQYLTHSIHPYPAKFIPQIPKALIQELSSVGDVVLDVFCGSGTTLLEALLLKRYAVGVDANPLACLISRAKTSLLNQGQLGVLTALASRCFALGEVDELGQLPLFANARVSPTTAQDERIEYWFDAHVIRELSAILAMVDEVRDERVREVARCAFSSIVVAVSRQDSDTRYVRRNKRIKTGETFTRFARSLLSAAKGLRELATHIEGPYTASVIEADVRHAPKLPPADLLVCSPPYPNAYSYHLYHMTRMLWLGMDQPAFKAAEIGSHRKYSSRSRSAATVETFRTELASVFRLLSNTIKRDGFATFVIGDSTIRGEVLQNDALLVTVALANGFVHEATLGRRMNDRKKAFNPSHGRIKQEKIVILRNAGVTP